MLGGRKLEIGFAKKSKSEGELERSPEFTDLTPLVRETAEVVTKTVVITVGSYILMDTIRQILVKLTPER